MLLDIGCGTGALSPFVKDRFDTIVGLDLVEGVLVEARGAGEVPVCGTFNDPLPFLSNTFDAVVLLASLQLANNPKDVLVEVDRVTRPGGIVVLSVPNMRVITRLIKLLVLGTFPQTSADLAGYDGGTLHYFCFRNVAEMLQQFGLRVIWQGGAFPRPQLARLWPERPGIFRKFKSEFLSAEVLIKALKPLRD